MKKLFFSLMTMLGVAFSNAGSEATTLADTLSVEAGASISNFTTHRGLATREDSLGGSATLGAPLGGGLLAYDWSLNDTDDGGELDFGLSYSRGASLLGQDFGFSAGFGSVESSLGDREEIFAGLSYSWLADLTATVWHETENDWVGVELGASYDIATPVENLTVSPFALVNLADEYTAVELGVKAGYAVTDQLSISAKASFNNNDFEGSSFEVDDEWIFGAGATFKF
jgi:hypothetical protein